MQLYNPWPMGGVNIFSLVRHTLWWMYINKDEYGMSVNTVYKANYFSVIEFNGQSFVGCIVFTKIPRLRNFPKMFEDKSVAYWLALHGIVFIKDLVIPR